MSKSVAEHTGNPSKTAPANQDAPSPVETLPHDAQERRKVAALMQRLGITKVHLYKQWGLSEKTNILSYWLNPKKKGQRHLKQPSVVDIGKKAMQWYEDNKDAPSPVQSPPVAKQAVTSHLDSGAQWPQSRRQFNQATGDASGAAAGTAAQEARGGAAVGMSGDGLEANLEVQEGAPAMAPAHVASR